MNPNVGSPVQNFQGNGISPSPQMARVIPSQANNRYMQHMNVQQQQQAMLQQQQQQQQQQQNMNNFLWLTSASSTTTTTATTATPDPSTASRFDRRSI